MDSKRKPSDKCSENDEFEDTPKEKVLADLREAWHEALTGQTVPAKEALALLKTKLAESERG